MTKEPLKIISDAMEEMGIEYGFGIYTKKPIVYPYFVGKYQDFEPTTEDGLQTSTFILEGLNRHELLPLENAKEKIEQYFDSISGKTVITDNGSGVAVFFAGALIAPTVDAELKRIQINLNVKEWKVNK